MVQNELVLKGLNCAHCATVIRDSVDKLPWVAEVRLNLATQIMTLEVKNQSDSPHVINEIQRLISTIEDGVTVEPLNPDSRLISQSPFSESLRRVVPEIVGGLIFFFLLIGRAVFDLSGPPVISLFLISYLLAGKSVLLAALKNIRHGRVLDENFLMVIATIGAFAIGEFPEAVAVMLFYQLGEFFQGRAVDSSRRSIQNLLYSRPGQVLVKTGDEFLGTDPENVLPGTLFLVRPGDRIALDGFVHKGSGLVDTSALTGESYPRRLEEGDEVLGGYICQDSVLEIRSSKNLEESAYSRIIKMVEESSGRKAGSERFITKFARTYTPVVVGLAVLIALLPPLFVSEALFSDWVYRALVFLVVSCPCALVVSVPLSFYAGIGAASRLGILVKGGNYLEALNRIDTLVLDKTGTLTVGRFQVNRFFPSKGVPETLLLELAAAAEVHSTHPIAVSIRKARVFRTITGTLPEPDSVEEVRGNGVRAYFSDYPEADSNSIDLSGKTISAGKLSWIMEICGSEKLHRELESREAGSGGSTIHIALDEEYMGGILLSDELRAGSVKALEQVKGYGISKSLMLTGDSEAAAWAVSLQAGGLEYLANLLPEDKVTALEGLITEKRRTAFIGDGINDAPVLARADVGIAMGGLGSDAAIEAADIVFMSDSISLFVTAKKISQKTHRIVGQNIVLALGIKFMVLILASFGMAGMGLAIFADVGVTLLAVLNAMRIQVLKSYK
ncbi:MAG: heavy metal translocating P-type ATPase [Spirochaetales bacterium]|nr:heavy metal translocating P-type ATPase [Spirochaetales bacterium]